MVLTAAVGVAGAGYLVWNMLKPKEVEVGMEICGENLPRTHPPPQVINQDFVRNGIGKGKEKVVTVIDMEDIGETTYYCRCWHSKKVGKLKPIRWKLGDRLELTFIVSTLRRNS